MFDEEEAHPVTSLFVHDFDSRGGVGDLSDPKAFRDIVCGSMQYVFVRKEHKP